jgi:hypothetical protein
MKNLNENANSKKRYTYKGIINGYKQFDPTRGATYILDLKVFDTQLNQNIHKRVNVMRPLGLVELISMPYVTENTKLTMVVTFGSDYDPEYIDAFFNTYRKAILEISEVAEKINLFVVYAKFADNSGSRNITDENSNHLKRVISGLEKKFSSLTTSTSRILQAEVYISNKTLYDIESYRQLYALESISRNLSPDALIFVTPPGIEFDVEFLNRVRLNTIKENQIFFPIAFYQYHPNIIYEQKPYPEQIDLNKNIGYFNIYSYEFGSFYNFDYINTRNVFLANHFNTTVDKASQLSTTINIADYIVDLYELFRSNRSLHLIRATDQSLKYRWHLIDNCESRRDKEEIERCLARIERGLGNRAQLALHLVQFYKDGENAAVKKN